MDLNLVPTKGLGPQYNIQWSDLPSINRFIQPDTIIPDQSNSQTWNQYAYVGNNPIEYADPTFDR